MVKSIAIADLALTVGFGLGLEGFFDLGAVEEQGADEGRDVVLGKVTILHQRVLDLRSPVEFDGNI